MPNRLLVYFLSIFLLVACTSQPQQPTLQATNVSTPTPSPTSTNTPTAIPTFTPTPTLLPMAGPVRDNFMTRLGKGRVYDLTFSPDGKILSVATSIGVYLYQADAMELISFLPSKTFVKAIAFIDDENLMIGYNDSSTAIWNIENTPVLVDTLQHNDPPVLLAVTDENSILVVELGWIDRPVNAVVWDRINPISINRIITGPLGGAEFSREKNLIVLQNNLAKIVFFNTQNMRLTATICSVCPNFALSQSGDLLAVTTDWDQGEISIFDTTTQKEIIKFKNPDADTKDMAFTPDGKLLTLASSTNFNFWDIETEELANSFAGSSSMFVYSPDGSLIASISSDGTLTLLETKTGNNLFSVPGFTQISGPIFQGKYIASTSYQDIAGISYLNTIIMRDISTGEVVGTYGLIGEKTYIRSLTFSPDGKIILTSSWDEVKKKEILTFFEVTTGKLLQILNASDPIIFSPNGSMLATGTTGNKLVIWDIASGKTLPVSLGLVPARFEPYKKSLVFSPDGSALAVLSADVIIRDLSTGKRIITFESGLDPHLDFGVWEYSPIGEYSPDGKILASTWLVATNNDKVKENPKGVIILWDVLSGEKIAILDGHSTPTIGEYSNSNAITALTFSPDGNIIASGAEDNTIIIWDVQNRSLLKILEGHIGAINSLAFSPDGNLLYSNSLDGTVIIWNMKQLLP